jgi:hypothetical protein
MKHAPTRNMAKKHPKVRAGLIGLCSAAYFPRGMIYTHERSRLPANTVSEARYFPRTIPVAETGDVRRSASVLRRFSSENDLIVRRGRRATYPKIIIDENEDTSDEDDLRV